MTEADVRTIVDEILKPGVDEIVKTCTEMDVKSAEVLIGLISKLTDRVNSNSLKIYQHISFFKAVLIAQGLTTEAAYGEYIREWERLNPDVMKHFLPSVDDSQPK